MMYPLTSETYWSPSGTLQQLLPALENGIQMLRDHAGGKMM
jgi:hypothetical protein